MDEEKKKGKNKIRALSVSVCKFDISTLRAVKKDLFKFIGKKGKFKTNICKDGIHLEKKDKLWL